MLKFISLLIFTSLFWEYSTASKGGWSQWSDWSGWGKGLCSGNQRVKTRTCTNPLPTSNAEYCDGENAIQEDGPVDGGLSEWSQWSTCERPCGGSVVNRTRQCDNPPPSNHGALCKGHVIETKLECVMPCPDKRVDGEWSPWSPWSSCPSKCSKSGGAIVKRYRQCNMPLPMFGGSSCPGKSTEEIWSCFDSCPRNGGFGTWSSFTLCSRTCGSGVKVRSRNCNRPEPLGKNAKNCTGIFVDRQHCKNVECAGAVDGHWSNWSGWSRCTESKYCNKGVQHRQRRCDNPSPSKGGDECEGIKKEVLLCPTRNCQEYRPPPPPILPVDKSHYLYRECGATSKYVATGAGGKTVPQQIYNHIKSSLHKFRSGYFATSEEEDGKIVKYCFEPWPALTIREAANIVPSYRKTKEIPNYEKPSNEDQAILGFSIRVHKNSNFDLKGWDFGISEVIEYIPGNSVHLYDVMFTYYSEGSHWGFLAKGDFRLFAPVVFKSIVFLNQSTDESAMVGKVSHMKLAGLINALGVPDDIGGSMGSAIAAVKSLGVWQFTFSPVSIAYDLKHKFKSVFRITATASFGGIPLHFEVLYIHSGFDRKIAFAFTFDGESYGSVLEKMAGASSAGKAVAKFFNAIGLQVELGVAWCPSMFGSFQVTKTSKFHKQPLKDLYKTEVPEGLTAVAQVSIPKDCKGSSFCEITKKIIGPKAKFRVAGQVKKGYYKITGGLYKIRITGNYYFEKLELFTEVNTTSNKRVVGFKAEVKIPVNEGAIIVDGVPMENNLKLGGMLKHTMGSSDLTGQLYMKGMWHRAFGLSWLNIGNINLGITITLGSPIPVTGFQFGGQLEFGNNCIYDADFSDQGHCLRFQIYFGYGKPTYFYGKVSALTIGKLVRMCGGRMGLPSIVAESGFPKGLMVQNNPSTKDIDLRSAGGPIVYQGFRMKGTLNLFGYEIKTEIKYSPREVYIDGELDPVNLGGHVVVSRNASHRDVGPKLFFHYKAALETAKIRLPFFKMYFEGYLKILGIEASAYINITTEQMEMYVYGKVWNLLYAELYVAAGYGFTDIKNAHFYIRVIVDLRGLTDAIENAKQSVDKAFKYAQQRMRDAIDKVKQAKEDCKRKLKIKCDNCYSLKCRQATENCKGFLDKAGRWIGGVVDKFGRWVSNVGRKIKDGLSKVGNGIKKIFRGWRRRRDLLAGRNEHFDIHIRQKRFVSKFICEGIVGGSCKGISHLCYGTCKAVDFIGQGLCHTLDIAVGALKLTEKTLGWVNAAVKFLLEIFLVHGIRFDLGLGQKFNGFSVGAEIDLTIFGKRMYFGFQFDLNNPVRSIMSAKDGSLYRYKAGVRQLRTETTFNPYDRPNPFADFDLAGTFGIEALSTGTENRLGACFASPNGNDLTKIELVGCNATDERQRWTYTLKGSLINLHSRKCLIFPNKYNAELYQQDCSKEDRLQMHECDVTTRTLKLRRSNLCASAAVSSPNGPGALSHLGSLKCVHIAQNNRLVLKSGCHKVDIIFELKTNGYLIYKPKDYCVRAVNNNASPGAKLELVRQSVGCHKFSFTKLGSLQHINSRLCVQTLNKEMLPRDLTELILGHRCEYTHNKVMRGELPDPQMTFAFVPYDNKVRMKDCNDFYDHRGEQRFSIMYEELQSVCSKFSRDLALMKVASQSSIKYNGFPSRAVDGNFNFQWEKGSCMNTNEEMDPWWRVDLGREFIVTDVTIINRGDHGDKLRNFQVHVGNSLIVKRNPACHDRVRQASDGEAIRLQCDPPIPGRFVGVQIYGKGMLSMCEVIVASRLGGFVDYCQIENGGCQQICNNKCGRSVSCSCLPGYKLAYDGRTCIDINECLVNNGGCRTDKKTYCVNYPGGFQCRCPKGYILKDNDLFECMDLNECGIRNGGCEQMCDNKEGGYMCNCRKGYERKPNDPYGCQNINECEIDNGGCSHICNDYEGGHYCTCQAGYSLMIDGKRCEEMLCSVLEAPFYGSVTPKTCVKRFENINIGTVCKFECRKGFELISKKKSSYLTCRIDGTWDADTPSCHPVKCPMLPRPVNGGLVPARCHDNTNRFNEFGQRCVAYCKHGYRLRGPATKYCQADKTWTSGSARVECIKVIEPPYLNCPNDIEAVLPSHQSWLTLENEWQEPQTNINKTLITVVPSLVGPKYYFKYGKTVVSYLAKTASDDYLSCTYMVNVLDKTPPSMKDCPTDIHQTSSNDRVIITWKEPTFTDNVQIKNIIKPNRKPGNIWHSGESMTLMYLATDTAGNTKKCSFKVSFKSTVCPILKSTTTATVTAYQPNRRYAITCKPGLALFGNFGLQGGVALCKNGDYYIDQEKIGLKTPQCVGFQKSTASGVCAEGSVKFQYEDFFMGTIYYCALCPAGKFYSNVTRTCELCKQGKYQDEQGKTFCETCPNDHSTEFQGASSQLDCLRYCPAGYFSASGFHKTSQPCTPCVKGTYSYVSGSTECISCPEQATTVSEGATDVSQCRRDVTIDIRNTNVRVKQFNNVRFPCYFTGLPAPKAEWTKMNGKLPALHEVEDLYDTKLNVIGKALIIYKTHANEAGTYRCSVINKFDRVYKDVKLTVYS